ncbi:MAG: class I SAM-dependent methyltransferase [Akkermansiaceae bacterium]
MSSADPDPNPLFPPRPTALAQEILRGFVREGDRVIDATAGNGHDTIFLAECVGETGSVLAFDVQEAAIISARARVAHAGYSGRVGFFHESHEWLDRHVADGSVAVVMFNLGYLPGADHELTTEVAVTLVALEKSARALKPGGFLSVICYPGHPAGAAEAVAVETWLSVRASAGWRVVKYGALATRRPAPFLLLAGKGE